MSGEKVTLALSKGRILNEALPLLAGIGIRPLENPAQSRKLILATGLRDVRLLVIRAQDVTTYVDYGAADLGIAGRDVLLEYEGDGLYEPLDLGIARCMLVVAGRAGTSLRARRLRVATKYVNTARRYFAAQGVQADIIKLYGSMELAPLLGLADVIVDLVDTGKTLRENGLVPLARIAEVSSQLIVNKAAMKMKHTRIRALIAELGGAVAAQRR
ncbi:MAG: ATP phosphoribosyltransferase [Chromatiales bacterium]